MTRLRDPLLIVILLVSLALGASILTRGHDWGDDWASYVMQAQSILNSDMDGFIERNTFTIFESSYQIGPVAYPWGYPLVLIPPLLLKGVHALTLKLAGLFFFAGFLVCLYLLTEKRLTRTENLLLVSLFAFNPVYVGFLDYILSDIPFVFSVFLALVLIAKLENGQSVWQHILLGLVIFFAFFIRTTGIILLAGFLVYQALLFYQEQNRRKAIAQNSMIVVATFILLWLVSSAIFPNGQGAYFRQLAGFTVATFVKNVHDYFHLFVQFFTANPTSAWTTIYYALVAFFLSGAWTRRRADQMWIIFFVFYFAVMLVWPEWQGIRFIFPLIPIFIYFAFQGMLASVRKLPERYHFFGKGISYLFWLALAGIFLFQSGTRAYSNLGGNRQINGPFEAFSTEMYDYVKAETPPDSVIVFFKPRALRLFTDRDSIMALECEHLLRGDYVVLHKNWEYSQILPKDISNCNLPLKNVYENRKYIVYKLEK